MIKLKRIKIKGFRSFGSDPQELILSKNLNLIWAGNSQGKTSFTEAMEFLLTGNISRRDILAGSKDEFADALKNAFLAEGEEVYVEVIVDFNGAEHSIKRALSQDFGKRNDCTSTLLINGKESAEDSLRGYGIFVGLPPIGTSILMQHCLGYLLTSGPQSRADFFRAIFELNDVEDFRNTVAKVITDLKFPSNKYVQSLEFLSKVESFKEFGKALKLGHDPEVLKDIVSNHLSLIIDGDPSANFEQKTQKLQELLEAKELQIFPIALLKRSKFDEVKMDSSSLGFVMNEVLQLQIKTEESVRNFLSLYAEVEKLYEFKLVPAESDECPICTSKGLLNQDRVDQLIAHLRNNKSYQKMQNEMSTAIAKAVSLLSSLIEEEYLPKFMKMKGRERKQITFTKKKLEEFVPDEKILKDWLLATQNFKKSSRKVSELSKKLLKSFKNLDKNNLTLEEIQLISKNQSAFDIKLSELRLSETAYGRSASIIHDLIQAKVSEQTSTVGWKELFLLGCEINLAERGLKEYQAFKLREYNYSLVLEDIDKAKARILESKFELLSAEVKKWWDLLRPDEKTAFEHLKPRPQTKRNIDFKVRLSNATGDKHIVRDAIAIFSQSQINCLGLAAFLAKKMNSSNKFLMLDDPVLSVDENHRVHFIHSVIDEILRQDIQLILLTQDQPTWSTIQNLYSTYEIKAFQFDMENPASGTQIVEKGDSARAQLSSIKPYLKNEQVDIRKVAATKMRDAAERLCKEILVHYNKLEGKSTNILTYSGRTLGTLIDDIQPFMKDPSHPGKWRVIRDNLNPGSHDSPVPSKATLSVSHGDLCKFENEYLK